MSRRCACKGLMEIARRDPRLKLVPSAARWLWLMLADQLADAAEPGVFRFGVFLGVAREISALLAMPETEVETHLETLLQLGLLARAADGALIVPALAEQSARRGVGGRRRKGETAEEYQARQRRMREGQRQLPLMQDLGGGKTPETPAETRAPPGQPAKLAEASAEERPADAAADLVKLGDRLAELAGLDAARGTFSYACVRGWLALPGATAERILAVVRPITERGDFPRISHLGYFSRAVREAAESWGAPAVAAPPSPEAERRAREARAYNAEMQKWQDNGCWGPQPTPPAWLPAAA